MDFFTKSLYRLLGDPNLSPPTYGREFDPEKVTVVAILDPVPFAFLEVSTNLIRAIPSESITIFENFSPDILLCESSWVGNQNAWGGRIAAGNKCHPSVKGLVDCAKEYSIPSVFWYTSDLLNVDAFKATASMFDIIIVKNSDESDEIIEKIKCEEAIVFKSSSLWNFREVLEIIAKTSNQTTMLSLLRSMSELSDAQYDPVPNSAEETDEQHIALTSRSERYAAIIEATSVSSLARLVATAMRQTNPPTSILFSGSTTRALDPKTITNTLQAIPVALDYRRRPSSTEMYGVSFTEKFEYSRKYSEIITSLLSELDTHVIGVLETISPVTIINTLRMNYGAMAAKDYNILNEIIDDKKFVDVVDGMREHCIFDSLNREIKPRQLLNGYSCA